LLFNFTKTQWRRAINAALGWFIGVLQLVQTKNEAAILEEESSPPPTISQIYDSLSTAMTSSPEGGSDAKEQPAEPTPSRQQSPTNNKPKPATKSAPLRSTNASAKVTSTRGGPNRNKPPVRMEATGGSSFEAMNAAAIAEEENAVVPATSMLAGLLPTLVAGLVFTTAGSMVGYVWNSEWTETASSVFSYFWGDETDEASSPYGSNTNSATAEEYLGDQFYNAAPVTPDR
ncbi:unnamed protein product, partial [Pseudo-nitzschia multistriata]